MAYRDIDIGQSDEQRAMVDTVRKFGAEVARPAGIQLDKLGDPAEVIARDSVLWDVFKKHRELGLHRMSMPKAMGGLAEDIDPLTRVLIGEEMGHADAGLAISLGVAGMPFAYCALAPNPVLRDLARQYVEDTEGRLIGCWAITEPDHGSDWILGGEDARCGPSVRGVRVGDEYVVNGEKAAWVSNGTIATHAVLHVGLDPSRGMQGHGIAIIPLDLPGISRGKPLDKIGQRPLNQGSIVFEEARIPKEFMLLPDVGALGSGPAAEARIAGPNGGMAITFAGLARAAFEEAFRYAKDRVQGGVPIFEHKNIKLQLFKMFTRVEAARGAVRRMAVYNASHPPSGAHAVACKCFSTETAFQVASDAMQIFGGNGLSRDYPIEKMFRDARAAMIEDGVNETLALAAVEFL